MKNVKIIIYLIAVLVATAVTNSLYVTVAGLGWGAWHLWQNRQRPHPPARYTGPVSMSQAVVVANSRPADVGDAPDENFPDWPWEGEAI